MRNRSGGSIHGVVAWEHIGKRIHRVVVHPDFVMKMGANGTACVSHITDNLVTADKLPRIDQGHLHVAVAVTIPLP